MNNEDILKKLKSYNINFIEIKFFLLTKEDYLNYNYILKKDKISTTTEDKDEYPYLVIGKEKITFYMFKNSSKEYIIDCIERIDMTLDKYKNNNELFFYLKENYVDLTIKEERMAKVLSISL